MSARGWAKPKKMFKIMYIFDGAAEGAMPRSIKRCLVGVATSVILITAGTQDLFAQEAAQAPKAAAAAQPPYTQQAAEQLQQLVAPIALYPDSLVAQILAASTFPEQVVEANRWVQAKWTCRAAPWLEPSISSPGIPASRR